MEMGGINDLQGWNGRDSHRDDSLRWWYSQWQLTLRQSVTVL
jgi:hypothetical protein